MERAKLNDKAIYYIAGLLSGIALVVGIVTAAMIL